MPVYEVRYKPWEGVLKPPVRRLMSVPKFTLMTVWSKWVAISLFGGGFIPLVGFTCYLLVTTNPLVREILNIGQFIDFGPRVLFERLLIMQVMFSIGVALLSAPRMISSELANRAMPLIYSRPISRFGYITGKFLGLFALLSLTTWVQSLLLWIIMFILYPDTHLFHTEFMATSIPLLCAVLFIGVLIGGTLSLVALACSAATKSMRYGAVLFFAMIASTSFITNFLQEVASRDFPNIGLGEIFYHLVQKLVRGEIDGRYSLFALLLGVVIWAGGALLFMLWKLKPVDVYGD